MEYKDSPEEMASDTDSSDDLPLDLDKELDFQEEPGFAEDPSLGDFEQLSKKGKNQANNRFSLKARRAIEDHLERRKLRKELDYLFDDDFAEGEEKQ